MTNLTFTDRPNYLKTKTKFSVIAITDRLPPDVGRARNPISRVVSETHGAVLIGGGRQTRESVVAIGSRGRVGIGDVRQTIEIVERVVGDRAIVIRALRMIADGSYT